LSQEAHLELTIFINFEELLEAFLEHRVTKRGRHDIETSCHFYIRLHLYHTDLIDRGDKNVKDYTCSLCSLCALSVKFDRRLQVTRVISVLLDVQVGSNPFFQLLVNNFSRSNSDGTAHEVDDSRATISTACQLKHADANVQGRACASCRAIALLCGPGIWLQIVENRV